MEQASLDQKEKEERLKQMRLAQKKLRERRKREATNLQAKIQTLIETNERLTSENQRLQLENEKFSKLLGTNLTVEQKDLLLALERSKSDTVDDYIPLEECKRKQIFYGLHYSYFDCSEGCLLTTIAAKLYMCLETLKLKESDSNAYDQIFRHSSLYGVEMSSNYAHQIEKFHKEGLVHKSWYAEEAKEKMPKGAIPFSILIQSIIDKFHPSTINIDYFVLCVCHFAFGTDFGPAIMLTDLQKSVEVSSTRKPGQSPLLGFLEREVLFEGVIEKLDMKF